MSDEPFRILPRVDASNEHFWTGGREGKLQLLRCRDCDHLLHPPQPVCSECHGKHIEVAALSGRATLLTYTVNHQPWIPGFDPPYIVAIVEVEEQPGVRLTTNLVNVDEGEVEIGMRLRVVFEPVEDVFLPLFEPDTDGDGDVNTDAG